MRRKFTKLYGREADWQGHLDEELREVYLQMLESDRHTLVNKVQRGEDDGGVPYMLGKSLLDDLPGGDTLPSMDVYESMRPEHRARTIQRMLTDLSDRLPLVLPPPQNGGGGGGNSQGQNNQQQQQSSGSGSSGNNPKSGTPSKSQQPQATTPKPAKPEPKKQPPTTAAAVADKPTDKPATERGLVEEDDPTKRKEIEVPDSIGGWSTGISEKEPLDYSDPTDDVPAASGGGGKQILARTKDQPMFYAMRDVWNKLAVDTDFAHKLPEGSERWNLHRVFKSHYNVSLLRNAKEDYGVTVEDIYFSLDTSGSVRAMADRIAAMAAASVGVVHLFHGTEGRPEYKILRKEPLKFPEQSFPEWDNKDTGLNSLKFKDPSSSEMKPEFEAFRKRFEEKWRPLYPHVGKSWGYGNMSFELDVAWMLETERPAPGSLLAFWGDTQGLGLYNTDLLKAIIRPYRFVWMYCYSRQRMQDYLHGFDLNDEPSLRKHLKAYTGSAFSQAEVVKFLLAGLPVIFDVNGGESLRVAMRQLEVLKKARA